MAEVNDVFKEVTAEKSYYDPSKKKSSGTKGDWKPYREGDYLGHITDVESVSPKLEGAN